MKRKVIVLLILIPFLFVLSVSCSLTQKTTPKQDLLKIRMAFNQMARQYISERLQFSVEDQTKIVEWFELGSKALDSWQLALAEGKPTIEFSEDFLNQKRKIVDEIGEVMRWR